MITISLSKVTNKNVSQVGGKNASLGEMISVMASKGIKVPGGFALTVEAYRLFLEQNQLHEKLQSELAKLDVKGMTNLPEVGKRCRLLLSKAMMPDEVIHDTLKSYHSLSSKKLKTPSVAVRSSATAEDLPTASFAGQHDSFLNISGDKNLIKAIHKCYVSLYNDRAIKYREDNKFDHLKVELSVGVQKMVRSDKGCAGVAFTIEPESGNKNIIYITGAWGLGENIVQGAVNPDEYYFFKPAITLNKYSLICRKLGSKEQKMIYSRDTLSDNSVVNIKTTKSLREQFVLTDKEAMQLAKWCAQIENHYKLPMDIEWAKDGESEEIYIVQARPETVHSQKRNITFKEYKLKSSPPPILKGKAVGKAIVSGRACVVDSLADAAKVQTGDIIIADITNPDWNALLRKAVSIVTNKGGRTSHASIVARELGISAVVGTGEATQKIKTGQLITVSCAQGDTGYIYDGKLDWDEKQIQLDHLTKTRTAPMFILADPDKALSLSLYPNKGVGLLRMEFIINILLQVHPMALVKFDSLPHSKDRKLIQSITKQFTDKTEYFIYRLAEGIAMIAAAFYPKEVIVRMSDFKTNEYAQLVGGKQFEQAEENPMIGFRGASRYYNPLYREAFGLECKAIKKVRDDLGLTNVKVMIPFCRTINEGKKVLEVMADFDLKQGVNNLEVYVMAEIPSNVILAKEFANLFDGFSIGSNDLTQLTLGIDRDSAIMSELFDERNEAVIELVQMMISNAKKAGINIGLCGQAPSDYPQFASILVDAGIDSISFNPDAMLRGIMNIIEAEKKAPLTLTSHHI